MHSHGVRQKVGACISNAVPLPNHFGLLQYISETCAVAMAAPSISPTQIATQLVMYLFDTVDFLTRVKLDDCYQKIYLCHDEVAAVPVDRNFLRDRSAAFKQLPVHRFVAGGLLSVLVMFAAYFVPSGRYLAHSFDYTYVDGVYTALFTGMFAWVHLSLMSQLEGLGGTAMTIEGVEIRRAFTELASIVASWRPAGALLFCGDRYGLWGMTAYMRSHLHWPRNLVPRMLQLENARMLRERSWSMTVAHTTLATALAESIVWNSFAVALSTYSFRAAASACRSATVASRALPLPPACLTSPWTTACVAHACGQRWALLQTWLTEDLHMSNGEVLLHGTMAFAVCLPVLLMLWSNVHAEVMRGLHVYCMDSTTMAQQYFNSFVVQLAGWYFNIPLPCLLLLTYCDLQRLCATPVLTLGREDAPLSALVPMSQTGLAGRALCFPRWKNVIRTSAANGFLRRTATCMCCSQYLSTPNSPEIEPLHLLIDTATVPGYTRLPPKPWQMDEHAVAVLSCGHAAHATCLTAHETACKSWPVRCPTCSSTYASLPVILAPHGSDLCTRQAVVRQVAALKPELVGACIAAVMQLNAALVHASASTSSQEREDLTSSLAFFLNLADRGTAILNQFLLAPSAAVYSTRRNSVPVPVAGVQTESASGTSTTGGATNGPQGVRSDRNAGRNSRRRAGSRSSQGV